MLLRLVGRLVWYGFLPLLVALWIETGRTNRR